MAAHPRAVHLARAGQVVVVAGLAAIAVLAGSGHLDGLSLDTPRVMWPLVIVACVLVPAALFRRSRVWLTVTLPVVAVTAAATVSAIAWYLKASDTITDSYPPSFLFWAAASIATVLAVAVGWRRAGPGQRLVGLLAAPICVVATVVLINTHYGYWPTLGNLLGHPVTGQISEATLRQELAQGIAHRGDGQENGGSSGQSAMVQDERDGQFAIVDIPGTVSGFHARRAGVYLPPAYFTSERGDLPVLMMLGGTPSDPTTLATAGGALSTANQFAASHDGMAPVMLFPDANGSWAGDTECVDGPRGRAETYLSVDVVHYATQVLHLTRDPHRWGLVGFSEGGTCALDLILRHPAEFRTFVDLAGDERPFLAHNTLGELYDGSRADAEHHSPKWLMTHRRYPEITGWFGSGEHDPYHVRVGRSQLQLARAAGMRAWAFTGPDGHDFKFATFAFREVLPQLFAQLGPGPEVI